MDISNPKTVGAYVRVDFPALNLFDVVAKIDTGALSGALHATDIQELVKDGKRVLKFYPFGQAKPVYVEHFREKPVRSSNGERENRYLIETTVVLNEQTYPIAISLTDRSRMRRAVLIGRRFLRDNHLVVDVRMRAQYRYRVKD